MSEHNIVPSNNLLQWLVLASRRSIIQHLRTQTKEQKNKRSSTHKFYTHFSFNFLSPAYFKDSCSSRWIYIGAPLSLTEISLILFHFIIPSTAILN